MSLLTKTLLSVRQVTANDDDWVGPPLIARVLYFA